MNNELQKKKNVRRGKKLEGKLFFIVKKKKCYKKKMKKKPKKRGSFHDVNARARNKLRSSGVNHF